MTNFEENVMGNMARNYPYLKGEWFDNVKNIFLNSKSFDPHETEDLEEFLCEFYKKKYAVAVNSGTTGIWASLLAAGVGPGDDVILPNYGHPAAYNSIRSLGANPVPVDFKESTLAIDPQKVRDAITYTTKAVVHIETNGWLSNDIEEITNLCNNVGVTFIEDSAPSFGATLGLHKKAGTFGDLSIFSFSPGKHIFCGEGGVVLTDNDEFYKNLLAIRYDEFTIKENPLYNHNLNLSPILASLVLEQLYDTQHWLFVLNEKQRIHSEYSKYIEIYTNTNVTDCYPNISYFSKHVALIKEKLDAINIDTRINPYPIIDTNLPISNRIGNTHIDLPSYIGLESEKIKGICTYIKMVEKNV